MIYYYDTSSILNLQEKIFEEPFLINSVVISELEHIKTSQGKDQDVKYRARSIVRLLTENIDKFELYTVSKDTCQLMGLELSNDNLILCGAIEASKGREIVFVTDDLLLRLMAISHGLEVKCSADITKDEDKYIGYKTIVFDETEMAEFYTDPYNNVANCLTNQYLFIKNTNDEIVDKVKYNGEKYVQLSYKTINNDFIGKIKPINIEQELAFDLLQDSTSKVKIISGVAGGGKDFIMIANALQLIKQNKYKKILWVRNNIEVKNTRQIGFLPGTKAEKLIEFAMPLADHLGGKDGLDQMVSEGKIEVEHIGFLRGRNLEGVIIYVSEAENTTTEIVQLLIGRVAKNSMLWLNGDYRQVDEKCFEVNNGLKTAIDKLRGNPLFGYVNLCRVERSDTAQLAELLY